MSFNKIAVLGLGKVGHLAAELLVESGFSVTGIDARVKALLQTSFLGAAQRRLAALAFLGHQIHGLGIHGVFLFAVVGLSVNADGCR